MEKEKEVIIMLVKKKRLKFGLTDLLLIIISAAMLIGIKTLFKVCEPKSGDMIMSCHWAGNMITAMSVLLIVLAFLHIIIPDMRFKGGIALSIAGISIVTLLIPGRIIALCKMEEMSCRSNTQLWTVILCGVLILVSLIDIIVYLLAASKEKHIRMYEGR